MNTERFLGITQKLHCHVFFYLTMEFYTILFKHYPKVQKTVDASFRLQLFHFGGKRYFIYRLNYKHFI